MLFRDKRKKVSLVIQIEYLRSSFTHKSVKSSLDTRLMNVIKVELISVIYTKFLRRTIYE